MSQDDSFSMSIANLSIDSPSNCRNENEHWTHVVPQSIAKSNFRLCLETPESARSLYNLQGFFGGGGFVTRELEQLLWESFIEKDYDLNEYHMLTLRDDSTPSSIAVGVIFWRDLSRKDMKKWISAPIPLLQEAKSHSLALGHTDNNRLLNGSSVKTNHSETNGSLVHSDEISDLYDDWIKIELVLTHRNYRGRRIGTMLLAAALVLAAKQRKEKSILSVAGGYRNVPAVQLFKQFGFREVSSKYFSVPNSNLFVLFDIHDALQHLDWGNLFKGTKDKTLAQNPTNLLQHTVQ